MECRKAIETKECICVLIEATLNPKIIVQPLIEICSNKSIPVLCLADLKSTSKINFGIATTILGVKQSCLPQLEHTILKITKRQKSPETQTAMHIDEEVSSTTNETESTSPKLDPIQLTTPDPNENPDSDREFIFPPYIYRLHKNARVFEPAWAEKHNLKRQYVGQKFISVAEVARIQEEDSKQYETMVVKKIASNPNRNNK